MKYIVQLLNYDSEWVTYCVSTTRFNAECAVADLQNVHGFQTHQIQVLTQ